MSGLRAFLDPLYALATEIETLMDEAAGELAYIDWDDLNETAVRLRAFANLIATSKPEQLLEDEIRLARQLVAWNKDHLSKAGAS